MRHLYLSLLLLLVAVTAAQTKADLDMPYRAALNTLVSNARVRSIALQPDGKIVMAGDMDFTDGSAPNIVRLNSDGSRDTSFNAMGFDIFETIYEVKVQADGKIIAIGNFTVFNGVSANRIVRLNSDGSVDGSFNIGTGFDDIAFAVDLQSDGKIVVGGSFSSYNGNPAQRIVRLNPDGTFDSTFNMGTGISGSLAYSVSAITIQTDDKILLAGDFLYYNGNDAVRMARLNANGTFDSGFGAGLSFNSSPTDMKVQPNGKILVCGGFTSVGTVPNCRRLVRLHADGVVDTTFTQTPYDDENVLQAMALTPDGKIVVGGSFRSHFDIYDINVLNNNGTRDTSFNPYPGFTGSVGFGVFALAVQPDGKILMGGNFDAYHGNYQMDDYARLLGSDHYTFQGQVRLDVNVNGCDSADLPYAFLKYTIANGTTTADYIGSQAGMHQGYFKQGTSVVTPHLENPDYFTISPANLTVNYPGDSNPYNLDFCVMPNGVHSDVEVYLLPLNVIRPGFDSHYKLVYRNKGNQVVSGSVSVAFQDELMDVVAANPAVFTQTVDLLTWAYTDLLPFETREILFSVNVNTPSDVPPVAGGESIACSATISTGIVDETPDDNAFLLTQTVVNSFDPNDKTCLQGQVIAPEMAGEFVDYMIRFENTGTYPAQNISVKDAIDLTRYELSTLRPTSGSHPFVTRITGANNVEFFFENIVLPFDENNNDGYVAFKIRTKSTLIAGDSFSNTASIFFDYNLPILTNSATTTLQSLGTPDFDFGRYFTIYPVPVHNVLRVYKKATIQVQTIDVYDVLGQLTLHVENASNLTDIDVSGLVSGNYFIKIHCDHGVSGMQFTKL